MEKMGLQEIMPELSLKLNELTGSLNVFFHSGDNVRIISFLLLFLAIALFILLMIVVYVRHIISIVKGNTRSRPSADKDTSLSDLDDIFGIDDEEELEKELQRELELANAEQKRREEQELEQQIQMKEQAERQELERKKKKKIKKKKRKKR